MDAWHFCNQIWHFTASMGYFPLYSLLNFPVLQSLFGLVPILHFDGILVYILQAHLFSNFTARNLVIFHSTFSNKASLRLYVLHINPPLILKRKFNGTFWHIEHGTVAIYYWYNKRWRATKHDMTKFTHYMTAEQRYRNFSLTIKA